MYKCIILDSVISAG